MSSTLDTIVAAVEERTAQSVARAVSRLTSRGEIREGDRLPTVRELGAALGVSPTTIADAWRILSTRGLIITKRRGGTVSAGVPQHLIGSTFYAEKDALAPRAFRLNLTSGSPDPELLPDLAPIFGEALAAYAPLGYQSAEVIPQLEAVVCATWPFETDHIVLAHGSTDALDRVISATVSFGERVLVEKYTFPPLLELLRAAGAEIVPVQLDEQGLMPNSLAEGLQSDPVALFLTPRAHNPTGVDMTAERCTEIARLLTRTELLVVEDDYLSAGSDAPLHSIGAILDDRVVHIRGYSKAYGPDLRMAAIGGPENVIGRLRRRNRLGPAWVSSIVQHVLLWLLTSEAVAGQLRVAAATYRERRGDVVAHLAAEGLGLGVTGSGYNLWLPVLDESEALLTLATYGIAVSRGSSFGASPPTWSAPGHIRITVSSLLPEPEHLARMLAAAARSSTQGSIGQR